MKAVRFLFIFRIKQAEKNRFQSSIPLSGVNFLASS